MLGARGLRKAGPSASRFLNGPRTHLRRMRSEGSCVDGVMGVVVSALSFKERASGQNYKYQDAQKDRNQRKKKKKKGGPYKSWRDRQTVRWLRASTPFALGQSSVQVQGHT